MAKKLDTIGKQIAKVEIGQPQTPVQHSRLREFSACFQPTNEFDHREVFWALTRARWNPWPPLTQSVEYAELGEKSLSPSCDRKFTAACFFFSFFH